jgi:rRNA maturation protein Nop10
LGFGLLALLGFSLGKVPPSIQKPHTEPKRFDPRDSIHQYSRSELKEKLKILAATPVPMDSISFGAMCYAIAVRKHQHIEKETYHCPKCGSKTVYHSDEYSYSYLKYTLPACEALIKEIEGIDLSIDPSQFCKKCSNIAEPQLGLIAKYSNDSVPAVTYGIGYDDIQMIQEFLNGRMTHEGAREERTPLKNSLLRLETLLGVKVDE